jgi:hypothetical protein
LWKVLTASGTETAGADAGSDLLHLPVHNRATTQFYIAPYTHTARTPHEHRWLPSDSKREQPQPVRGCPRDSIADFRQSLAILDNNRPQSGREYLSPVTVGNSAAGQIVRRHFHRHAIPFEDADTEPAELARDGRENRGSVFEGNAKRRARKDFRDGPFEFNQVFFGDTIL